MNYTDVFVGVAAFCLGMFGYALCRFVILALRRWDLNRRKITLRVIPTEAELRMRDEQGARRAFIAFSKQGHKK